MAIDTQLITKLRQRTGVGVADCKEALVEAKGDMDKAVEILRKKGALKAAKKSAERTAHEGVISSYIHSNSKIGVLLQVNCETDFVARNEDFQQLVKDLALHIAAANPSYVRPEEVPQTELDKEREVYQEQLRREGKPSNMIDKIIEGKVQKYYTEVCLLKQPFVKDESLSVEQLVDQTVAKIGEKIEVARFTRYAI